MRYLLDTNTVSYLNNQDSEYYSSVRSHLAKIGSNDEALISILSYYEIQHSFVTETVEEMKIRYRRFLDEIRTRFPLSQLSIEGAESFADIKDQYKLATGITANAIKRHSIDFMLASSAIADDMVLVSNDGIFKKIQEFRNDLRVENWAQ